MFTTRPRKPPSNMAERDSRCANVGPAQLASSCIFQAEDGIRDYKVTGVQTCALPIQAEDGIRRLQGDWSSDVCSSDLAPPQLGWRRIGLTAAQTILAHH